MTRQTCRGTLCAQTGKRTRFCLNDALIDELVAACEALRNVREIDRGREQGKLHITSNALRTYWDEADEKARVAIEKAKEAQG